MTDSGDACRSDSLPCHVQDASLQLMRKCVTFFDNVSPCFDDVAFLTVDGFCAESGNLDVGVSDVKEFKSVFHEHCKAFFRK